MSDRPDLLAALPSTVAGAIRARLPELTVAEGAAGPFDLGELKARGLRAPGVIVSCLSASQGQTFSGDFTTFGLDMAAYVFTRDGLGLPRDIAAATICQAILGIVPGRTWGYEETGPAERVAARSLVTRAEKNAAVSLWAVTWRQPVTFVATPAGETVPIQLYLGQAPDIGLGHEDDYVPIGSAA